MKKFTILSSILLSTIAFSQVGINKQTFEQGEMFRVAQGTVTFEQIPVVTNPQYVMITDNIGHQQKISFADLKILLQNNSFTCPTLSPTSSPYYLLFTTSSATIPNPTTALTISGKNFAPAGSWIVGNTYFISYTNTSGTPLNMTTFNVTWGPNTCTYTN